MLGVMSIIFTFTFLGTNSIPDTELAFENENMYDCEDSDNDTDNDADPISDDDSELKVEDSDEDFCPDTEFPHTETE